jgi:hypothetical protein
MPRKFWLMPGLEFHKLRAEMPPNQCAYACFVRCVPYSAVLDYTLGLTCKQRRRTRDRKQRLIFWIILP